MLCQIDYTSKAITQMGSKLQPHQNPKVNAYVIPYQSAGLCDTIRPVKAMPSPKNPSQSIWLGLYWLAALIAGSLDLSICRCFSIHNLT